MYVYAYFQDATIYRLHQERYEGGGRTFLSNLVGQRNDHPSTRQLINLGNELFCVNLLILKISPKAKMVIDHRMSF